MLLLCASLLAFTLPSGLTVEHYQSITVEGIAVSAPRYLTAVGDRVYFSAEHPFFGRELMVSDLTVGGTTLVADLEPGIRGSNPHKLTVVGPWLYFRATTWHALDTRDGSLTSFTGLRPGSEALLDNTSLIFWTKDERLVRLNGHSFEVLGDFSLHNAVYNDILSQPMVVDGQIQFLQAEPHVGVSRWRLDDDFEKIEMLFEDPITLAAGAGNGVDLEIIETEGFYYLHIFRGQSTRGLTQIYTLDGTGTRLLTEAWYEERWSTDAITETLAVDGQLYYFRRTDPENYYLAALEPGKEPRELGHFRLLKRLTRLSDNQLLFVAIPLGGFAERLYGMHLDDEGDPYLIGAVSPRNYSWPESYGGPMATPGDGFAYFTAYRDAYRCDGTAIQQFSQQISAREVVSAGETLVLGAFNANPYIYRNGLFTELELFDGFEVPADDAYPGLVHNGRLYTVNRDRLWVDREGGAPLELISEGIASDSLLVPFGERVLVQNEAGVWVTDGTPAGSERLLADDVDQILPDRDRFFSWKREGDIIELMRWDEDGPVLLEQVAGFENPYNRVFALGVHQGEVYFPFIGNGILSLARAGEPGEAEIIGELLDISDPIYSASYVATGIRRFTTIGGDLYIEALEILPGDFDPVRREVLFRLSPGDELVRLGPGSQPVQLAGGIVASDWDHLVRVEEDGVSEITPLNQYDNDWSRYAPVDGTLAFMGENGLWLTDGTVAGTTLRVEIERWRQPFYLGRIGRHVLYGVDRYRELGLWSADLETGVATLLRDDLIMRGDVSDTVVWDNRLYFIVEDPVHGLEVWASDGTPEGTGIVVDLEPGVAGSAPKGLKVQGNSLVFRAQTSLDGTAWWRLTNRLEVDILAGPVLLGSCHHGAVAIGDIENVSYAWDIDNGSIIGDAHGRYVRFQADEDAKLVTLRLVVRRGGLSHETSVTLPVLRSPLLRFCP